MYSAQNLFSRIAKQLKITSEELEQQLKGIQIPELKMNVFKKMTPATAIVNMSVFPAKTEFPNF